MPAIENKLVHHALAHLQAAVIPFVGEKSALLEKFGWQPPPRGAAAVRWRALRALPARG